MANEPSRLGRRAVYSIVVLAVLAVGYFGVMAAIRAYVDGMIKAAVDRPMPSFRLTDRAGREWTKADLDDKRVVLHFFRSRCHSCNVEAPEIRALENELPADVAMLHVMTDRVIGFDEALTAETLADKNFARPVMMADEAFMNSFHTVKWSQVTPITYVVDAKGIVRLGLRGAQTRAQITEALAAVQ